MNIFEFIGNLVISLTKGLTQLSVKALNAVISLASSLKPKKVDRPTPPLIDRSKGRLNSKSATDKLNQALKKTDQLPDSWFGQESTDDVWKELGITFKEVNKALNEVEETIELNQETINKFLKEVNNPKKEMTAKEWLRTLGKPDPRKKQ